MRIGFWYKIIDDKMRFKETILKWILKEFLSINIRGNIVYHVLLFNHLWTFQIYFSSVIVNLSIFNWAFNCSVSGIIFPKRKSCFITKLYKNIGITFVRIAIILAKKGKMWFLEIELSSRHILKSNLFAFISI